MSVKQVAKNAVILGLSSVVSRALGIVGIGLTARLLGVEGFGAFNTVFALVTIAGTICAAGTGPYVVRETSASQDKGALAFLQFPLLLSLGLSALALAILPPFLPRLAPNLPPAAHPMLLLILVLPLFSFLTSLNQGLQRFGRFFWMSGLTSMYLCSLIGAVYLLGLDDGWFYRAYLLAHLLSLATAAFLCRAEIRCIFRDGFKPFASFHRHGHSTTFTFLFASSVLAILFNKIDIFLLNHMLGAEAVGTYSASYRIFEYVMYLPGIISAALLPVLASAGSDRVDSSLFVLRTMALSLLPLLAGLIVFKPEIFTLLYGADFSSPTAFASFTILTFGVFFCTLNSVLGQIIYACGGYKDFISISASALACNLALNLALIPLMAGRGAAVATVASFAVSSLLHTFFASRRTGRGDLWIVLALGSGWFSGVLYMVAAGWSPLLALPASVALGLLARFILPGDFRMAARAVRTRLGLKVEHA